MTVAWQGGEPTMMGLDFFRRSVELAEQHRMPHQRIAYTIQTNATLIDEEWAAFFQDSFLVGVSIDGPKGPSARGRPRPPAVRGSAPERPQRSRSRRASLQRGSLADVRPRAVLGAAISLVSRLRGSVTSGPVIEARMDHPGWSPGEGSAIVDVKLPLYLRRRQHEVPLGPGGGARMRPPGPKQLAWRWTASVRLPRGRSGRRQEEKAAGRSDYTTS